MNHHPVSWENLIDWLDGRLEPRAAQEVEEHLAGGCPSCEGDLAWLRRFRAASAATDAVAPPAEVVRRAKAAYRARQAPPRRAGRGLWPARLRRLAPVWGALLVVIVAAAYLFQAPAVFARQAVLGMATGTVEARQAAATGWQGIAPGSPLGEGDEVRVVAGRASLTLFDSSTLELQPGAQVVLTSLRSGLPGGAYRVAIYQGAGAVRYDVPGLRSARSNYYVESPTAHISVQGTTFVVVVDSATETGVTVLRGSVSAAGTVDSVLLGEGQAAVIQAHARVRLLGGPAPATTQMPTAGPQATQAPGPQPGQGRVQGEVQQPTPTGQGPGAPRPSATQAPPAPRPARTPGAPEPAGPSATRRAQSPTRTSMPATSPGPRPTAGQGP